MNDFGRVLREWLTALLVLVDDQAEHALQQRFPTLGGKQTISTDGGWQPGWSLDGRELFYLTRVGPPGSPDSDCCPPLCRDR